MARKETNDENISIKTAQVYSNTLLPGNILHQDAFFEKFFLQKVLLFLERPGKMV